MCRIDLLGEFQQYFGHSFEEQARETVSEDFAVLANAIDVPYAFWYFGTMDAKKWDDAKEKGKLSEIPGNYSPFYAPVIHPCLEVAIDAMSIAALVFLEASPEARSR